MIRTCLSVLAATIFLTGAATAQDAPKDAKCREIGQIVTNIMAERKNGSSETRTVRRVSRSLPDDILNNRDVVEDTLIPEYTKWIFSLPEEQMTPEVSNALYQACLSQ